MGAVSNDGGAVSNCGGLRSTSRKEIYYGSGIKHLLGICFLHSIIFQNTSRALVIFI